MNAACEAAVPGFLGWRVCGVTDDLEFWRYGCRHEHISERWACPQHRPELGKVGCRACFDLGHECPMLAQKIPA